MMRDTSTPLLVESWNETGNQPICACTFSTKFRNQPLRGFRQQLSQRKRSDSLNHGCSQHAQHQRLEQLRTCA